LSNIYQNIIDNMCCVHSLMLFLIFWFQKFRSKEHQRGVNQTTMA